MEFSWIYNLPAGWATFFMSMLPIAELRASIPIALTVFDMPVAKVFPIAVLGNYIPGVLIIYFVGPISDFLRKWKPADKFFIWLFARTRRKFHSKYEIWGKIALMLFVAIPLPVTGVWTGSLAAWLFDIKKRDSLIYIFLGACIAGIIVSLISLGTVSVFTKLV